VLETSWIVKLKLVLFPFKKNRLKCLTALCSRGASIDPQGAVAWSIAGRAGPSMLRRFVGLVGRPG